MHHVCAVRFIIMQTQLCGSYSDVVVQFYWGYSNLSTHFIWSSQMTFIFQFVGQKTCHCEQKIAWLLYLISATYSKRCQKESKGGYWQISGSTWGSACRWDRYTGPGCGRDTPGALDSWNTPALTGNRWSCTCHTAAHRQGAAQRPPSPLQWCPVQRKHTHTQSSWCFNLDHNLLNIQKRKSNMEPNNFCHNWQSCDIKPVTVPTSSLDNTQCDGWQMEQSINLGEA